VLGPNAIYIANEI